MSTYTRIVYQVVFSTKFRRPTLLKPGRERIFRQWTGLLKSKRCRVYQIGGVEDHVHLVFALHPSVSLANLVKDLKLASSDLLRREPELCPDFDYWQGGYSAFTYTPEAIDNLVYYVKNQETHHAKEDSPAELRRFLEENEIIYDERYFE